jgi:hypothetical protein
MSLYLWQYTVGCNWSVETACILADIDLRLDLELDRQFYIFSHISVKR